jgi:N-acetylated-alpha-linked acidic dipeptidase
MNTPLDRALQIVEDDGHVIWDADLTEHAPEGDRKDQDAVKFADAVATFHGLSRSGDVTSHLIYGNYCSKEVRKPTFTNKRLTQGIIGLR